jgi:hypothetical protein
VTPTKENNKLLALKENVMLRRSFFSFLSGLFFANPVVAKVPEPENFVFLGKGKYFFKDGFVFHTIDENGVQRWFNKEGQLHREDSPAIIQPDGAEYWYLNGEYHREDGPAYIHKNGFQAWYLNGKCHRENGPAKIWENGYQEWHFNGKLHREDGPAVIRPNGTKEWWVNGELHREDGPAVITTSGYEECWLNGEQILSPK